MVTLWAIQKQEKSYLLPAVVIKCARDLYEFGDALYYRIAQYADEELENEGFNPHLMIIRQCIIGMSMDLLKLRDGRFQKGFTMHCR